MSQVIAHEIEFKSTAITQTLPTISVRNKSPQHEKQTLIDKIEFLAHANDRLEVKQESLQNTVLLFLIPDIRSP